MRQTTRPPKKPSAEAALRDIRRAARRQFSAEEKVRIVLEGLRGEDGVAELCRREGIATSMDHAWSKEVLDAGERRLAGDTARAATPDEVRDPRREAGALKEVVADLTLENRLLEKSMTGAGEDGAWDAPPPRSWRASHRVAMRSRPMANRLVEQSHRPVRRALERLGVPRATFYRWVDLYRAGGPEALEDRPSRPSRVWNRLPGEVRGKVIALALEQPELSPRELAVRFTDEERCFVSEATVDRLLKAHDLITSPAYIVIKAADACRDKTTAPNRLWSERLHLPEGHRLGLVLPVHGPRRLLALRRGLEALRHQAGLRR